MSLKKLKAKLEEVTNTQVVLGGIDNAPEEKERGITINTFGGSIDNAPEEKERG
jgi:translation elongation factor EF-Tu-like GTPase